MFHLIGWIAFNEYNHLRERTKRKREREREQREKEREGKINRQTDGWTEIEKQTD